MFAADNKSTGKVSKCQGTLAYTLSGSPKWWNSFTFFNLFPDEIYNTIDVETNKYAVQKGYTVNINIDDNKVLLVLSVKSTYIKYPFYIM